MSTWAQYKKIRSRYQDKNFVSGYDGDRFGGLSGRMRNARVLNAVGRAVDHATRLGHPVDLLLDVPVGTGRLIPLTLHREVDFVGGDLSVEMMERAAEKMASRGKLKPYPLVRCDAERLPFGDNTFDATVTLRFMTHLPRDVRVIILRELRRVSSKWVIIDCRNTLNAGFVIRWTKKALGLPTHDRRFWSKAEIAGELREAGLQLIRLFPAIPFLSDQWIVLAAKST